MTAAVVATAVVDRAGEPSSRGERVDGDVVARRREEVIRCGFGETAEWLLASKADGGTSVRRAAWVCCCPAAPSVKEVIDFASAGFGSAVGAGAGVGTGPVGA